MKWKTEKGMLTYYNKHPYKSKNENYYLTTDCRNHDCFSEIEYVDGIFVEHIFSINTTKTIGRKYQEIMAIDELGNSISKNCYYSCYGCNRGFKVYFKRNANWYYGTLDVKTEFEYNTIPSDKVYRKELFDIAEVIALDNSLKYCAYKDNCEIKFIDYVRLYRKYPIAEMLMKLELYRMINEKALKVITENAEFRKYLFKYHNDLKSMAFTTVFNAFKSNKIDPSDYYCSLMDRIEQGKKLSNINENIRGNLYKYHSREAINEYLEKNKIDTNSYNDFLIAVEWLKLDFEDTKNVIPNDFWHYHDLYCKQYSDFLEEQRRLQAKAEEEKEKSAFVNLSKVKAYFSNLLIEDNDYKIEIPSTMEDFIKEGKAQDNCVGRMGYYKRMANGDDLILFLRKENKPYATVEIGFTNGVKLKQCYIASNKIDNVVTGFMNEFIEKNRKYLNKQHKQYMLEVVGE